MGTMTPVQTQNKSTTDNKSRNRQATAALKTPTLKKPDPVEIIYRIRKNPDSIAREDIMTLQNTLGNHAVSKLLTEINSKSKEKLDQVKQDEKDKTVDSSKAAASATDKKSAETKIQLNAADNSQKEHKQDVPLNKIDTQKNNIYEAGHKTEPENLMIQTGSSSFETNRFGEKEEYTQGRK
jgi:transcriptional regulator of heat shock response